MRKTLIQLTMVAGLLMSLLVSSAMAEIYNFGLQFKEKSTKAVDFFGGSNVDTDTSFRTLSIGGNKSSFDFSFNTSALAATPGIDGFTLFIQATGVQPMNQYMGDMGMPMWMQEASVSLFDTGKGWVQVASLDDNLTPFVPVKKGPVDAMKLARKGHQEILANNTFFTSLYIPGMPTNDPEIMNPFAMFADEIMSGTLRAHVAFNSVSATDSINLYGANLQVSSVPVPGAVWLLGSGLVGLMGLRRRFSLA